MGRASILFIEHANSNLLLFIDKRYTIYRQTIFIDLIYSLTERARLRIGAEYRILCLTLYVSRSYIFNCLRKKKREKKYNHFIIIIINHSSTNTKYILLSTLRSTKYNIIVPEMH